jgi:hypothetical protein
MNKPIGSVFKAEPANDLEELPNHSNKKNPGKIREGFFETEGTGRKAD